MAKLVKFMTEDYADIYINPDHVVSIIQSTAYSSRCGIILVEKKGCEWVMCGVEEAARRLNESQSQ